eukprot:TRINITY_DN1057_c0_g1_i2.p1 TRINITY_DN1057_c0_g1~~TRINITY_DN1057_c0_g1_i2.p1  ORF type:complete len:150 (-),score=15.29 TRINITY_DN1057_c0_g1_i2:94-543(-)
MRVAIAFLLLAVAYAQSPATWKQTGGVGTIKSLKIDPDPAVAGKPDTTYIEIDYEADTMLSGNWSLEVYFLGAPVDHEGGDVCPSIPGGCPCPPGDVTAVTVINTPSYSLDGNYTSQLNITGVFQKNPGVTTMLAQAAIQFEIVRSVRN